jgi:3-oxoacyl-[acyl-carrier protein] reductase
MSACRGLLRPFRPRTDRRAAVSCFNKLDLAAVASTAPGDVTLVVLHTAVLAYIADPGARDRFARAVSGPGVVRAAREPGVVRVGRNVDQQRSARHVSRACATARTARRFPAGRGRSPGRLDAPARRLDRLAGTEGRHGMTGGLFRLDGKAALVTGASGGIGAAIARALHTQGATVVLSGTRRDALDALAAELSERVHVCPADLADPAAPESLAAEAEAAAGPLAILVNNAGVTRDRLALRMLDEDWQAVLDVNLTAPFRLIRAVLRGMLRRRAGRIVNISSIVGATGNPGQANYAAAKAGMVGMTKALAQEVASRGVTLNVVAPGFVVTPMTDVLPEAQKAKLAQAIPLGRLGQPADIAAAVAYLASEEAGWVTGATLHVNGGMAMV